MFNFKNYNFIIVTHYDIGKANNDVCQGNLPFGNPVKQHITKFHNVILLPFYLSYDFIKIKKTTKL